MIGSPATVTVQNILVLARQLSAEDRRWLTELLTGFDDAPLPEVATVEEAIALYLADACSLGRAAELAKVTRWDLIDQLKARGIPILIDHTHSTQEIDDLAAELARSGIV